MEKREPSYTAGGNASWYSHYRRQYGGSSENVKDNYHVVQQSQSWVYTQMKLSSKKKYMQPYVQGSSSHNSQDKGQPLRPSTEEQIERMGHARTMDVQPRKGTKECHAQQHGCNCRLFH